jgi:hypothetical protein
MAWLLLCYAFKLINAIEMNRGADDVVNEDRSYDSPITEKFKIGDSFVVDL